LANAELLRLSSLVSDCLPLTQPKYQNGFNCTINSATGLKVISEAYYAKSIIQSTSNSCAALLRKLYRYVCPLLRQRPKLTISLAQVKKYTKEHEWIELSPDNKTGVVGISEYAAHALGDVVYVELPTTPMEVSAGDSIGAVESVKSASDINSPITSTITEVNSLLEEKPGTINKGPEDGSTGGGWVAKVKVGEAGVKDLENLMDAEAYAKFTEEP
jgi:glycine cleavage system H protein